MRKTDQPRETESFLRFLIKNTPELDPPEDFAFRGSPWISSPQFQFSVALQSMGQKLVPVFMTLAVLACALTYLLTWNPNDLDFEVDLIIETQELQEEITVEYVLDNVGELPGGERR